MIIVYARVDYAVCLNAPFYSHVTFFCHLTWQVSQRTMNDPKLILVIITNYCIIYKHRLIN